MRFRECEASLSWLCRSLRWERIAGKVYFQQIRTKSMQKPPVRANFAPGALRRVLMSCGELYFSTFFRNFFPIFKEPKALALNCVVLRARFLHKTFLRLSGYHVQLSWFSSYPWFARGRACNMIGADKPNTKSKRQAVVVLAPIPVKIFS